MGLGEYLGVMGPLRDVVTDVWKTGIKGIFYTCIRCLRQTSTFFSSATAYPPNQIERERCGGLAVGLIAVQCVAELGSELYR